MYNILAVFGYKFQKLPMKKNIHGMLRKCAALITHIGSQRTGNFNYQLQA
jgi:hypothetical protein